jgi:hypothetical protein
VQDVYSIKGRHVCWLLLLVSVLLHVQYAGVHRWATPTTAHGSRSHLLLHGERVCLPNNCRRAECEWVSLFKILLTLYLFLSYRQILLPCMLWGNYMSLRRRSEGWGSQSRRWPEHWRCLSHSRLRIDLRSKYGRGLHLLHDFWFTLKNLDWRCRLFLR